MSGLEKIIEKIKDDCTKECAVIEENAKQSAEKIIAEEVEKANTEAEKIIEKAKEQSALTDEKSKNGAELLEKKIRLQIKNEVISEIISESKNALKNLDANEYFEIMKKLIVASARSGEGILNFSSADLKRVPADFEKTVNWLLGDGKTVKVNTQAMDIDSGFVLCYDGIEENCTIDALIETNLDLIRDKINSKIFA